MKNLRILRIQRVLRNQLDNVSHLLGVGKSSKANMLYWNTYNKIVSTRGKHSALILYKHYYDCVKSLCLNSESPGHIDQWVKRDKLGTPTFVNRLINELGLDISIIDHKRFLLTFFSQYEALSTDKVVVDVSSLTKPQDAVWSKDTVREFKNFFKHEKFIRQRAKRMKHPSKVRDFVSLKGGPYGIQTPSWIKDLIAIGSSDKWLPIINLEKLMGCDNPISKSLQYVWALEIKLPVKFTWLFKTFAIPDKGPKVRTVTNGNYYISRALLPIHHVVMDCLKEIPEDGTHRQDRAAKLVQKWTSEGLQPYCYDLTAATDRMPINIQAFIFAMLKLPWAHEWYDLMVRCSSFVKEENKFIELSVGQPMGVYTSWPAFTLAHHYIIRFAFYLNKVKPANKYAIIGDDVAILDENVALTYRDLILGLGIGISETKSLGPYNTSATPVGELAKRLFYNGIEISPIRPLMLISLAMEPQGPGLLKAFALEIVDRWRGRIITRLLSPVTSASDTQLVLKFVPKGKRSIAKIVLNSPFGGRMIPLLKWKTGVTKQNSNLLLLSYTKVNNDWEEYNEFVIRMARNIHLDYTFESMRQDLVDINRTLFLLDALDIDLDTTDIITKSKSFSEISQALTQDLRINPFYQAVQHIEAQIAEIWSDEAEYLTAYPDELMPQVNNLSVNITLIRDWCNGSIKRDFQDAKSKKSRALVNLALKVLSYCKDGQAKRATFSRWPPLSQSETEFNVNALIGLPSSSVIPKLLELPPD